MINNHWEKQKGFFEDLLQAFEDESEEDSDDSEDFSEKRMI